jgi:shikimate dehydrogenase
MSLAVSLFGGDSHVLARRLQHLQAKDRFAELRLDRLGSDLDWEMLASARGDLELILACVPTREGGTFDGSFDHWLHSIRTALGHFPSKVRVDVPPCFAEQAESELPSDLPRIWSWHQPLPAALTDFEQQFQALSARANRSRGDVVKLVAWAETHQDSLAVLPLYQLDGPERVIFAQGPGSAASRLWALTMGAPWTYACWRDQATAPGQWAEHLVRRRKDWTEVPLFGVMGDPVEHSRSPLLWEAALTWLRAQPAAHSSSWREGLYLHLPHQQLTATHLQTAYASKRFQAFSVTAPLKQQALQAADQVTAEAQAIGAANLLLRQKQQWVAHNTDGCGALDPLEAAGLADGAPVILLGAGGAARAAAYEAARRGHPVTIAARRIEQAQALAQQFADVGKLKGVELNSNQLWQDCSSHGFAVIQATPLGSQHNPGNPIAHNPPPAGGVALDMVYDPARTEFLNTAEIAGCQILPGHHMLLAQMLRQFELGTGQRPPEAALRIALERDLGLPCAPILLVGPRAAGKTTLGRMLAEALHLDFIDADDELEAEQQRSIREWIPVDEPGFREAEAELLTRLVNRQGAVVALGGGVVERPDSLALLAAQSRVLALDLSQQEQIRRRQGDTRPALIKSNLPDEVRVLHKRRAELYLKASSGRRINVEGNLLTAFLHLLQSINLIG